MATTATATTTRFGTLMIVGRFGLGAHADAQPAIDRLDDAIRSKLARIVSDGHPPSVHIEGAAPITRTKTDADILVEVIWDRQMTSATRARWTREALEVVDDATAIGRLDGDDTHDSSPTTPEAL